MVTGLRKKIFKTQISKTNFRDMISNSCCLGLKEEPLFSFSPNKGDNIHLTIQIKRDFNEREE
jgi:hypothetical protein